MFQAHTTKFICSYMVRDKIAIKNDIFACEDKNNTIFTCVDKTNISTCVDKNEIPT